MWGKGVEKAWRGGDARVRRGHHSTKGGAARPGPGVDPLNTKGRRLGAGPRRLPINTKGRGCPGAGKAPDTLTTKGKVVVWGQPHHHKGENGSPHVGEPFSGP